MEALLRWPAVSVTSGVLASGITGFRNHYLPESPPSRSRRSLPSTRLEFPLGRPPVPQALPKSGRYNEQNVRSGPLTE